MMLLIQVLLEAEELPKLEKMVQVLMEVMVEMEYQIQ